MKMETDNSEDFVKALEKISERVEKMPDWKKNGWAILEENSTYCGSVEKKQNFSDSHDKKILQT
jgi:hypothetical protein